MKKSIFALVSLFVLFCFTGSASAQDTSQGYVSNFIVGVDQQGIEHMVEVSVINQTNSPMEYFISYSFMVKRTLSNGVVIDHTRESGGPLGGSQSLSWTLSSTDGSYGEGTMQFAPPMIWSPKLQKEVPSYAVQLIHKNYFDGNLIKADPVAVTPTTATTGTTWLCQAIHVGDDETILSITNNNSTKVKMVTIVLHDRFVGTDSVTIAKIKPGQTKAFSMAALFPDKIVVRDGNLEITSPREVTVTVTRFGKQLPLFYGRSVLSTDQVAITVATQSVFGKLTVRATSDQPDVALTAEVIFRDNSAISFDLAPSDTGDYFFKGVLAPVNSVTVRSSGGGSDTRSL